MIFLVFMKLFLERSENMNNWIFLMVIHAFLASFFETSKKKAVEKNTVYEVLAGFSLIAFLMIAIITKDAFKINYEYLPVIFIKSSILVVAWILSIKALEKVQISLYSMIKISRIIFSVILSYIILGERITFIAFIGMLIIIGGLVLVNKTTYKEDNKKNSFIPIIFLLICFFLNSISAIIDKKILVYVTPTQLQFWFTFFLTIYYWGILAIKKDKLSFKQVKKNYWIPLIAICLVVGDRVLFTANANPNSKVIVITMINQLSVIISILLGKILFKEKDIIKKLLYSLLIILGVVLVTVF